jgi:hypothetical protein
LLSSPSSLPSPPARDLSLASAFVLQPVVLRPSFSSFELSRGISTVGGGYCHKCRS